MKLIFNENKILVKDVSGQENYEINIDEINNDKLYELINLIVNEDDVNIEKMNNLSPMGNRLYQLFKEEIENLQKNQEEI